MFNRYISNTRAIVNTSSNSQFDSEKEITCIITSPNKNVTNVQSNTAYDMPEYGFSMTRIFPYRDRMVRVRETLCSGIFYAVKCRFQEVDNSHRVTCTATTLAHEVTSQVHKRK